MGEEYVTRIIIFGGMFHGIAVFLFLTGYENQSPAGNVMDAIAHAKEVVAHGKQGYADAVAEHAERSRNHAERGGRSSHLAESIKHGKAGHAEAALGHLLEVQL